MSTKPSTENQAKVAALVVDLIRRHQAAAEKSHRDSCLCPYDSMSMFSIYVDDNGRVETHWQCLEGLHTAAVNHEGD